MVRGDDTIRVELYTGPRDGLRRLFELAEDSAPSSTRTSTPGVVLVAVSGDEIIGHLQLTDTERPAEAEIKNMAVDPAHQGGRRAAR